VRPDTALGKAVVSLMIMASFVFIPIQVNKLGLLLSQQSKYRSKVTVSEVPHALIVGHVKNETAFKEFVMEFMHPDRMGPLDSAFKKRKVKAVVVICLVLRASLCQKC